MLTISSRRVALVGVVFSALVVCVWLAVADSVAQERPDLKPFARWDFTKTLPTEPLPITLQNHKTDAKNGLNFTNPSTRATIQAEAKAGASYLPKKAMSIAAWVRIDQAQEWGGFLSCFQDNGSFERGWILGFNKSKFLFGLATTGRKDQQDPMTYHETRSTYNPGQWYHVVAVYDGTKTQLYVNGQLDGEETKQTGEIWYAEKMPFVVGRYQDDNEDFPMTGAIREVQLFHRSLTAPEIEADFRPLAALAKAQAAKPGFVIEPYLQFITKTSATIMAETPSAMKCEVKYGTANPLKESILTEAPSTMHEVTLKNLQPGTKYFYQVVCEDAENTIAGPILTFQTTPESTRTFSFGIIGDTQANPTVTAQIAKLMWEDRPNFVLHMGDVVDNGPAKREWVQELFKPCQELFGRVCVYPCIGNHEKNHAHYYQYFSVPKPEFYYSFTYGHAEFFSLDTNKPVGPGSEQYVWLEKALAASKAKWKFCYHHHPVYSSDSDDYGNTFMGDSRFGDRNARQLAELYEKYNVNVAMNGHIHVYERTYPIRGGKLDKKGVTYLTSGGGGGRLENFSPVPAFFKNHHRSKYHYCLVSIHENQLSTKVVDNEGRLLDQWQLMLE
jgi:acid phosphatase type 7